MQVCAKNDNLKGNTERSNCFLDTYVPTSNAFVLKRWLQALLSIMSSSRYHWHVAEKEAFHPADIHLINCMALYRWGRKEDVPSERDALTLKVCFALSEAILTPFLYFLFLDLNRPYRSLVNSL